MTYETAVILKYLLYNERDSSSDGDVNEIFKEKLKINKTGKHY